MKRSLIPAILALGMILTGCNAFRKMAGRPTTKELETLRQEIMEKERIEHEARIDSLRKVEQALADSIALMDSLSQLQGTVLNPAKLGGLFTTKLEAKYYVVVGAFAGRKNAEAYLKKVNSYGYKSTMISFRNGLNAIGICPTNDLNQGDWKPE